jgi:hypothetical protein
MADADLAFPTDLFNRTEQTPPKFPPETEIFLVGVPMPRNPRFIDLRPLSPFGRWTVLSYAGKRGESSMWNCQCSCTVGTKRAVAGGDLRSGKSVCCNCIGNEKTAERNYSHGMSGTKTYLAWRNLRARCEKDPRYAHVSVCQGWSTFEAFYADMGEAPIGENDTIRKRPEYSIDRVDNTGNYSCGHCFECVAKGWKANCKWKTQRDQTRNQKRNRFFEYCGQSKTIAEWSEITKIHVQTLWYRINHGLTITQAIEKPLKTGGAR